ncbi:MAG: class I tRNA ligase family protein, partial [Ruminococcus sp.]|nr:class I tRNA ligase family protein [Ruminococcus sp.]
YAESLIKMLSCICPHIGEEIWSIFGHNDTIAYEKWPEYDDSKTVDTAVEIAVQVNGKVKARLTIAVDEAKDEVISKAKADPTVAALMEGKNVVKEIYVPNKLVNIVVK